MTISLGVNVIFAHHATLHFFNSCWNS